MHEHLGDRAGNFRKDIDVCTARLVALNHAIGIDGRLVWVADRFKNGGLGLPLHAKNVGGDQSGQDSDDREGEDDFGSDCRLGRGGFDFSLSLVSFDFGFMFSFGFRFTLGFGLRPGFGLNFGFRFRFDFGLKLNRFGFGLGRGCFRLWLGHLDFRFRLVWIHSVPLSSAVRCPSSIWRIRSAYSLMRASWVTIRMQRFSLRIFSFTKAMIILPVSPSREAVGSSRIRISGRLMIARAIATRCCSPPESFTGRIPPRPFSPTISRYWVASVMDSFQLRCFRINGIATFSAVVSRGKRW